MRYIDVRKTGTDLSVIVVFTAFAAAVRLLFLTHPAPWADEFFSISYIRQSFLDLINLHRDTDVHPPLYYILLKSLSFIFGDSIFGFRALSVLFGVASVPFFYLIARDRLGSKVAVVSTLFFCVLPIHVHFSREIRMYSALSFFLIVAQYCFFSLAYETVKYSARKMILSIGFLLSLSASFYTNYTNLCRSFLLCPIIYNRICKLFL